ncbi:MAG: hypothetical protein HRT82_05015 [Henriciella sp.]|nr:hypothetical protein [Henriciella sp.]
MSKGEDRILRHFIDDVVTCMERERKRVATLEENCAPLDRYRIGEVVDEEVLQFIENVVVQQLAGPEDFNQLLTIFKTEPQSTVLDRVQKFMSS